MVKTRRQTAVGDGMTRLTIDRTIITDPVTDHEFAELREEYEVYSADPWGNRTAEIVETAKARLNELRQTVLPGHVFDAHSDEGFYLEQLIWLDELVRWNINNGDAAKAAVEAMTFGRLHSEMLLRLRWNDFAVAGELAREQHAAGGASTRKGSDAERVECWRRHFSVVGKAGVADSLAAEELNVSETTIRNARKAAIASD